MVAALIADGFRNYLRNGENLSPETLLDLNTEWKSSASDKNVYEGRDRATGELKRTATAVDFVFGSHSQLRALAECMEVRTRRRSLSMTLSRPGTR